MNRASPERPCDLHLRPCLAFIAGASVPVPDIHLRRQVRPEELVRRRLRLRQERIASATNVLCTSETITFSHATAHNKDAALGIQL